MIRWFARNDIAANFLLLAILLLGLRTAFFHLPMEVRPSYQFNQIDIKMNYRGGTPDDIERTIILPIEQALEGLTGVKEIRSDANSGRADIDIEPDRDANIKELLEEVQRRIDTISTFPDEVERPRIRIPNTEAFWEVITLVVHGDLSESDLLRISYQVRDDLLSRPGISQVDISGNRDREISIETDPEILRSYGLTIQDLTNAVQRSSIDLPAGSIQTARGRLLLRTRSQAYVGDDFRNIIIRAADGAQLCLGDLAKVNDGFTENKAIMRYDGERALRIEVLRSGNESAIAISDAVRAFVAEAHTRYPEGIHFSIWDDESISLRGRLTTLTSSLGIGALLVLVILGLFLRPMLAFWVVIGIPISFAGGLMMMPHFDLTLNMMSLFGFIIVVGIVVDDAIVTGENIYSKLREGLEPLDAAVIGTKEVATPVTFGALTTIVAFIPLMYFEGFWGNFTRQIPPVVGAVLVFSLIESKLVLPSHLKHLKIGRKNLNRFERFQKAIADSLETFVKRIYEPTLRVATAHRYTTVSAFIALALAALGLWQGGRLGFVMMPSIDRFQIYAGVNMPIDTPFEQTDAVVLKISEAAEQLREELRDPGTGKSLITGIMTGTGISWRGHGSNEAYGMVNIEILPPSQRSEPGPGNEAIERRLRELVGPIKEADRFRIYSQRGQRSNDMDGIEIELRGPDSEAKRTIARDIETLLEGDPGIYNAGVDLGGIREELEINLNPRARELNLTERELARQIRQAFFGDEAQRIQRDREEIRVMIRLPEVLRDNLHTLEDLKINTSQGVSIPFSHVATAHLVEAPARIKRIDGARVLHISASPKEKSTNIVAIADRMAPAISALVVKGEGLTWRYKGFVEEHKQTGRQTRLSWIILLVALYALLAIPFRSLLQPIFVLLAIPFGIIGALIGHLIMDITPSFLSVFGMMALAGVVVNDSLVMVDFTNRRRREGTPPKEAVLRSGSARFRPILLTSLTTFVGLMPLILDRSIQAQFLIPMAVSLAFGILFSTAITLYLIPCAYLINEDFTARLRRSWHWYTRPFRSEESDSIPPGGDSSEP